MAILPQPNLDYTDRDFASIRSRLYKLIASVFPTWTDQNVTNFGNILLELFSFVGDTLSFYQDNQARESRMITATQRKNVINLAKMLGYTPSGSRAAQATETFTLSRVPVGDVVIPAGAKLFTANITAPVAFQLLAPVTIPGGTNPPTGSGTVENSSSTEDTFTSSGLPDQLFQLSQSPYVDESAVVSASNGSYTQVDNFLDSIATDRVYTVSVDQNGVATITFGDGVSGTIPTDTITVAYKTGGGSSGNVDAGTIKNLAGAFTDSLGNTVNITCTNPQKAQGGIDPQTVAQIKVAAPASVKATNRNVSIDDFEIHAEEVAGVARALMTTSNEDPGVAENSGILYVVPDGGGVASSTLLAAVVTQSTVTYKPTLTFRLAVQSADYLAVNVFARVYKMAGYTAAQVAFNIRATLATYFAVSNSDGTPNTKIDFGAKLRDANGNLSPLMSLGHIFDAVDETAGVREIGGNATDFLLNNAHEDVTLLARQFPQLGTVTLIDADTGANM